MRLNILRIICFAFGTVVAVEVAAQDRDLSGYCQTGSASTILGGDQKALNTIRSKCKAGDTLVIAGGSSSTYLAARVCDFSKSIIVVAAGTIVCVHGAERPIW